MAMIHLHKGGTFFGHVIDYDWKGKFLVVGVNKTAIGDAKDKRIISWDNVESVYDEDYEKVKKDGSGKKQDGYRR